jgi:hypothetical protein
MWVMVTLVVVRKPNLIAGIPVFDETLFLLKYAFATRLVS